MAHHPLQGEGSQLSFKIEPMRSGLFLLPLALVGLEVVQCFQEIQRAKTSLLAAIQKPQSRLHREQVESVIDRIHSLAKKAPREFLRPLQSGSYRTVWTTVTADSFFGPLLGHTPGATHHS